MSTSSRIIVTGTKQLLVTIGYLFLTMKQLFLKLLEEILICFEEELWMLTLRYFSGFALCLWGFFGLIFLVGSF